MRIPHPWRDPLAAGRLLLLSTFADTIRRPTAATASRRNACVAALAHRILILHAAPGGKTAALCQQALAAAKPVYTLPSPHNAHLIALGAQPISPTSPGRPPHRLHRTQTLINDARHPSQRTSPPIKSHCQ